MPPQSVTELGSQQNHTMQQVSFGRFVRRRNRRSLWERNERREREQGEHGFYLGPWHMCKGTDIGAILLPLGQVEMTYLVARSLKSWLSKCLIVVKSLLSMDVPDCQQSELW